MGPKLDHVIAALHLQLERESESEASLDRGMHFPQRSDPYFHDWMSLADVYHYATLHFDAHRSQLTL
jgi:hypothetical protein